MNLEASAWTTTAFLTATLACALTGCTNPSASPSASPVDRPVPDSNQAQGVHGHEISGPESKEESLDHPKTIRPQECELISDCNVVRVVSPTRGRSKAANFSRDGSTIYYFGVRQDFDASSFSYFATTGCPLWNDGYVSDKNDIYIPSPQSCGGSNCGEGYTGFYWAAIGVRKPSSFVMLGGGYGRDEERVYYQWGARGPVASADPGTFEVMWCHAPGKEEEIVGRDAVRYFIEGKPVAKERVEKKWGV